TITRNLLHGAVLVAVILTIYLWQFRSAFIAALSIPFSLSIAMILLNVFGMPANLLSLGAVDFGIIVDASIIMVENIVRHLAPLAEHEAKPSNEQIQRTIGRAASEVARPILFATAIIICTFLPIFTFERVEGKLFRPLAVIMNFHLLGGVIAAM